MRVGIIALLHESNTLNQRHTTIDHFRRDLLLSGDSILERMSGMHHEVGGFVEGLEQHGIQAVGVLAARAVPFGPIAGKTFEELMELMLGELQIAGNLDGLLVAPHGATVSEQYPDADGHWLTVLRKAVGSELPIFGTLDAHANLSPAMVDATDGLVAYRTNPHLDQRERGQEAATLLARTLRGEIRPVQSAAFPPMAINIVCQQTDAQPCQSWVAQADTQRQLPNILSNSILLGFPYADVEEMGAAALVVTDNDRPLAERLARDLGNYLWTNRRDFDPQLTSVDQAIHQAMSLDGSVCLLDIGDNVGGGSPGDGTSLAHAIHKQRLADAFVCICDPEAVRQAAAAHVGARLSLSIGGKTDTLHGAPFKAKVTIVSLHDGLFEEPEPRHGGFAKMDQGRTVVVRTEDGFTIMLTSQRVPPFSLRQLTSCGLDPSAFRLIVAKGVIAPMAAYAHVCEHFIHVNTPGITTADLRSLDYRHRRRPMFPFESETEW